MREERKFYRVLVGKYEGKRPSRRKRRRWECGIRVELRRLAVECVEWIPLAQERDQCRALVNMAMNPVLAPRS
jgi:hypothetical protein